MSFIRKPYKCLYPLLIWLTLPLAGLADQVQDTGIPGDTPLNAIQLIGSHNSYKLFMPPELAKLLAKITPKTAQALHYEHETLAAQLNLGLRSLEIDVLYDPEGGHYAYPKGLQLISDSSVDYDSEAMLQPGYKVLHIQDLDFRSHCATFMGCLQELKTWSDANPQHVPVIVTMNIKQGPPRIPGGVEALAFSEPQR